MTRRRTVVILAAGDGRRMRSNLPKPLHPVGGRPLIGHVLATASALAPCAISVVVPRGGGAVAEYVARVAPDAALRIQPEPLGTANALLAAADDLDSAIPSEAFVLYGDTPLVRAETLSAMSAFRERRGAAAAFLGFEAGDPTGYGRIRLDAAGDVAAIVEERDATPSERAITLCNAGLLVSDASALLAAAGAVAPSRSGERYLTSIAPLLRESGRNCALHVGDPEDAMGVNDRADLAAVEAAFQSRARAAAQASGATLVDPATVRFAFDTELGRDVEVGPFVEFGPGVRVADGVVIRAFSSLEGCEVGPESRIGPHARLRPGSRIGARARIGNFVEVKAASIGDGVRIGHLAYVGDAVVGEGANIGAGAVTCNFDGVAKHRTEIERGAFVGTNASLIAPIRIGANALVGAGSVVSADVPPGALAVTRAPRTELPGGGARLLGRGR